MEPSSDIDVDNIVKNIQKSSLNRVKKRKKQLYADLRKQMEFYLSDANLRKDRYFGHLIQTTKCISVDTFLNCNKIKNLTTNPEDIIKAIESSDILAISDCKTKIYRIKPIEEKQPDDIERCTVYVEQLPIKADHDWVKSIFEKYGSVAYVSLPKFKSGTIKRFAFVEFENEESALKVIENYKNLHEESKILPEELQSIITFKEDENVNIEDIHKEEDRNIDKDDLVKKRKYSISTDNVTEKKLKKEIINLNSIETKITKKKKKIDKHKKSNIESGQNNSSFEISDSENTQKTMLNVNPNSSIEQSSDGNINETNIESNNDVSIIKKKRKRNKGKKVKLDTSITIPGLRIMSKTDWRKLRNQFLNMQRQKMSLLKAQLRQPRYNRNSNFNLCGNSKQKEDQSTSTSFENITLEKPKPEDIRVKYEPGVILKISFANPIESDKIFKAEAKTDSRIKFVDVINNYEAYVRCDCQESAKKISDENRWPRTSQLEGEEEKCYWEKILHDREIKCTKQKQTKKQRGRLKLINKAEKILTQHVKFAQDE